MRSDRTPQKPAPYLGIINNTAYAQLPNATREAQGIEAVLLEFDLNGAEEKPAWQFLVNPRSLQYSDGAEYAAIAPHATRVPERQFQNSTGATLSIPDLQFSTYCLGKSLRPLIEGVRSLLEAKTSDDKFSPPVLLFKMGSLRFGPCVLTQVTWDESAWLGGEPARVKMSLSLQEIPKPLTDAEREQRDRAKQEQLEQINAASDRPKLPLTERQRADASKAAKEYLEKNIDQWSADVQSLIKGNKYKLSTDPKTGDVTMSGPNGAIGVVVRSLGDTGAVVTTNTVTPTSSTGATTTATVTTTKPGDPQIIAGPLITTIPVKTGGKPPELKVKREGMM